MTSRRAGHNRARQVTEGALRVRVVPAAHAGASGGSDGTARVLALCVAATAAGTVHQAVPIPRVPTAIDRCNRR